MKNSIQHIVNDDFYSFQKDVKNKLTKKLSSNEYIIDKVKEYKKYEKIQSDFSKVGG